MGAVLFVFPWQVFFQQMFSWSSSEHEQKPKLIFLGRIKKSNWPVSSLLHLQCTDKDLRQAGESCQTQIFGVCSDISIVSCLSSKLENYHLHTLVQHHIFFLLKTYVKAITSWWNFSSLVHNKKIKYNARMAAPQWCC